MVLGMGHVHSKNFVFRDLKPENIMVARNGYAKLIDFGFAKVDMYNTCMCICITCVAVCCAGSRGNMGCEGAVRVCATCTVLVPKSSQLLPLLFVILRFILIFCAQLACTISQVIPPGERSFTLCGTAEYLAPEIVLGTGHDQAVDWWTVR